MPNIVSGKRKNNSQLTAHCIAERSSLRSFASSSRPLRDTEKGLHVEGAKFSLGDLATWRETFFRKEVTPGKPTSQQTITGKVAGNHKSGIIFASILDMVKYLFYMISLAGLFVQETFPEQSDTGAPEVLCAHIRYFPPYGEAEEYNCCFFLYLRIGGGDSLTLDSLVLNDSGTLCYPSSGKYLITKPRDVNGFQKVDTLRLVLPQQNCFLEDFRPVLYLKMISDAADPAVKPSTAQLYYTYEGNSDSISFPVSITVVKPDQIPIENPCFQ